MEENNHANAAATASEIQGKCCRQLSKVYRKTALKCCGNYLCNNCWLRKFHHDNNIRLRECPYCKKSNLIQKNQEEITRQINKRKRKYLNKQVIITKGIYKSYYGTISDISKRHNSLFLIVFEANYKKKWLTIDKDFRIISL